MHQRWHGVHDHGRWILGRSILALFLMALLVGCGDDNGNDSSTGGDSSPTSSGSSAATSTDEASPSLEPATGTLITDPAPPVVFSYRLPAALEWDLGRRGLSAGARTENNTLYLISVMVNLMQAGDDGNLDFAFETGTDPDLYDTPLVRGENRVVNGVEGWTATATDTVGKVTKQVYLFGTTHNRKAIGFEFIYPQGDAAGLKYQEAVLASIEWK